MATDYSTIASIQTYLDSILRGKLDDNIFYDAPLQTISDSWDSFVVVDLGTEIRDQNAFSDGTVRIMMYIRPMKSGMANVARTQQMEKTLNNIICTANDKHYVIRRLATLSDYDEDSGFHIVTCIIKIMIL